MYLCVCVCVCVCAHVCLCTQTVLVSLCTLDTFLVNYSLLRRSQLPVPPAEINYNETAKLKRDFGKLKIR